MPESKLGVQIRVAEPADAPSIAAVLQESFVEYKASYTDEAFAATTPESKHILDRMNEGPIWVAVRNAEIVGTVSAVSHGETLYIRGMGVLPSARGSRIGESLIKQVEIFASARGHKRLSLSTTPFLAAAIRLYQRMGFRRSDVGPHDLYGTPLFTMEETIRVSE